MIAANNVRELANLVRYFYAAYPLRSTLIVVLVTLAALAEGFGIASLLPLIDLVIAPEGARSPLTTYIEQAFALVGLKPTIGTLLVLIVVMIAAKTVLVLLAMALAGYSAAHVAMNMRLEVLGALLDARWQHFVDQRTGELAAALGGEPQRTANAYVSSCRAFAIVLQLVIFLTLSFFISWEISIAAVVVGTLGMLMLSRFVRMSNRAGKAQTELQKTFMTRLLQGLDGMKPLKAMSRERNFAPLVEDSVRGLNRAQRMIVVSLEAINGSQEMIRTLAVAAGLYMFLTIWIQPIDSLFVLLLLFGRTLQKVSTLQNSYQVVAMDLPAFTFVQSTIESACHASEPEEGGAKPQFTSAIALREVTFSYGVKNVLEEVSMELPAGKFISVVGASGVGKTTIADLIIGLLRPQRGDIWIDDLPMRNIDIRAWRAMIGYVPQETFLFHDTIMVNVTLGDPGISREQVEAALRHVEAWSFVSELPDGIDSVVGERGARLSGGQRQRIAIARAMIRKPALLVLDEATTALDPETEAGVVATVQRLAGRVTVLSISHQPAMRLAADIVYTVDQNRIVVEHRRDEQVNNLSGGQQA